MARLDAYHDLLLKWTKKINLIAPSTVPETWVRHFLDSAQLLPHVPPEEPIADLGAGAGFPGLVLAALDRGPVTLIEADARKATFIREAARVMKIPANVITARIEAARPQAAPIVTARALAPLERLLPWVHRHLAPGGKAVLLKGRDVEAELTESRKRWNMNIEREPSMTDPDAVILIIKNLVAEDVR